MSETKSLWYDLEPEVPTIPEGAYTLLFALVPREEEPDHPILHCAWRVPGRLERLYGARVPGATEVVAIDRASGAVFHQEAENGHLSPLPSKTSKPDPARQGVLAISGNWSMDVVRHVGLPPALYSLFLWLDDMTSDVKELEVTSPTEAGASDVVRFGAPGASTAASGPSEIELKAEKRAITGTVSRRETAPPGDSPLTVLSICHATRGVGWHSEIVPRALQQAEEWRFRVPLERALPEDRKPGPVSVLAFFDGVLSNAVTLEAG